MNLVDDVIRPEIPIGGWLELVRVPGGAAKQGAPVGLPNETKLAAMRLKNSAQMRCLEMSVRRELGQGIGLLADVEGELRGCLPDGDRFNETAGGKIAMPDCADAMTLDGCAHRIGDPRAKEEFAR